MGPPERSGGLFASAARLVAPLVARPERPSSTLVVVFERRRFMQGEREKTRDQTEGSGQQQGTGSEPPRSMGHRGGEFGHPPSERDKNSGQQGQSGTGQADLGTQAATTLAGRTDQQDLGQDQPGSSQ